MTPTNFILGYLLVSAIAFWLIERDYARAMEKAYKKADAGWARTIVIAEAAERINKALIENNKKLIALNDVFVANNNELIAQLLKSRENKND